jgi:hypothetical protein
MNSRIVTGALIVSAVAFATGASVFTADYLTCKASEGGIACREPRNMAAAAWAALATNALALATNVAKESPGSTKSNPKGQAGSV